MARKNPKSAGTSRKRGKTAVSSTTRLRTADGEGIDLLGNPSANDDHRNAIRLSFLLHDVSRLRRSAYDQFMKPLGMTRAQWWVLAHLSRHDGMMQTQLADVLEVGKASLGDVIEGLENAGWLQRRPDPADRRAKRVYLTKPAQGLIKKMTVMENEFNDQILGEVSAEERETLVHCLLKIKRAIHRLNAERTASAGS